MGVHAKLVINEEAMDRLQSAQAAFHETVKELDRAVNRVVSSMVDLQNAFEVKAGLEEND